RRIGRADGAARAQLRRARLLDVHERTGIRERQALELQRVGEAEDRGGRGDAEGQGGDAGDHQAWRTAQRPAGVDEIVEEASHRSKDGWRAPALTASLRL